MRQVVLLALLALSLPTAALAGSVDFTAGIFITAATRADPLGTIASLGASAAIPAATITALPTGDILTSTTFTFSNFGASAPAGTSGIFTNTFLLLSFGPVSLTTQSPGTTVPQQTIQRCNCISFHNAMFGTFRTTSMKTVGLQASGGISAVSFDAEGRWTPGTAFSGLDPGPYLATYSFNLRQTPEHTGAIASGGSFTVTRSLVPEPGTWSMLGTGLIGLAGVARRKLKL